MTYSIVMTVLGALFLVAGFVGCVIPALPGPILAFVAIVLVMLPGGWVLLPVWLTVALGLAAIAVTLLDNALPALSSRRAGASKAGIWGSIIGMIVGSFLTPLGTIIGAFAGAFLGELLFNRENQEPLKAAIAVFKGTIVGIVLKFAVTAIIALFFVRSAIRLFE